MANKSLTAAARKQLLRRGRSLLRLCQDYGSQDSDFLAGLSPSERTELEQIHAALERIERGIFGRCEACGLKMDRELVLQAPWRRNCAPCDEKDGDVAVAEAPVAL